MSLSPYFIDALAAGPAYDVLDNDANVLPSRQFKIVIVGDSGCGKTSLFSSYVRGSFPSEYEPTIFENHRTFLRNTETNEIICADLWDTAGQEEYERLRRLSYQDADVIILAYSLDAPESLPNLHEVWAPEVMSYAPNAAILLVALKNDIPTRIDTKLSYKIALNIGAVAHMSCSAKEMINVNELFDAVFNTVYNKARYTTKSKSASNNRNSFTNANAAINSEGQNGNGIYTKGKSKDRGNRNSMVSFRSKKTSTSNLKRKASSSKCTIL
ncbi:hypothetical protein CAS74_000869 [Pichia kudriavzevii]|uniref:GTP-binding protein RHO4 n=2 Tax=Pichia kudriavzevii TaxID=4909 RepID=A0A099NXK2_PICKU|nr:uncharacterized protein C5L36_0C08560 [Pichia kudriavzevii]AWU76943.1 hypothetical protein C5L36_0C08560 [Pichia kudriavzevii]KGK36667.1 hypothetical protein JL09_g4181 [Pichia kudriavzevii]ONH70889.1 GTP-binding protein RHO4 [Pichia kudriavzevii]ONH75802.1 GTP-binding protein RHO4 [Pichia kudriavzevii]OUT24481.1 hypothetical protein CAS74_000869 [Pichia kudriavzevii]